MLTEQVVDAPVPAKMHVPPGVKMTIPVGAVAPIVEVSVTVAVQLVASLTKTVDGVHATVVLVLCRLPTVMVAVPELVSSIVSPL